MTAYADRSMEPAALLQWDRHLVTCPRCQAAVDGERRMLGALRNPSGSTVPGDLRSMLLAVAAEVAAEQPADHRADPPAARQAEQEPAPRRHWVPPVPVAPVPVVDRCAPALHRSARRATVFAGLAASATAAATWGVVVAGAGPATTAVTSSFTPQVTPAVQRARTPAQGVMPASYTVSHLTAAPSVLPVRTVQASPAVSVVRHRSAQSTP